ncbi:hypothetical protein Hte_003151 [Hypoxylon texense]
MSGRSGATDMSQQGKITTPVPIYSPANSAAISHDSTIASQQSSLGNTPTAEALQPTIEEGAKNLRTGGYHALIQDENHLAIAKDQYLSLGNVGGQNCNDYPQEAHDQQQLVRRLVEASHDCSNIFEPASAQAVKHIQQGKWSDWEWEIIMWTLLVSVRDAQSGVSKLPGYSSTKGQRYEKYESFGDRFRVVLDAVSLSKDIVVSLFRDSAFTNRLAWMPKSEMDRKARNRKGNDDKALQSKIATKLAADKNIKANEDGELIDDEGEIYAKTRKRSAAMEEQMSKARPYTRRQPTSGQVMGQKAKGAASANSDQEALRRLVEPVGNSDMTHDDFPTSPAIFQTPGIPFQLPPMPPSSTSTNPSLTVGTMGYSSTQGSQNTPSHSFGEFMANTGHLDMASGLGATFARQDYMTSGIQQTHAFQNTSYHLPAHASPFDPFLDSEASQRPSTSTTGLRDEPISNHR